MTTEKLLPMVEATATSIPLTKTTTAIITNLSGAGSHEQNKRPTIIIYPTGELKMDVFYEIFILRIGKYLGFLFVATK